MLRLAAMTCAALLAASTAAAAPYYGKRSSEARFRFEGRVESSRLASQPGTPTEDQALELIEDQLQHLFGPWSVTRAKAVPSGRHEIVIRAIRARRNRPTVIDYSYEGVIVLESVPGETGGTTGSFDAILPVDPDTIYSAGLVAGRNACTDSHYNGESDFWYFWAPAPHHEDCPLVEGRDFFTLRGRFSRIPNTRTTYPEYHRLADPKTGVIEVNAFFGMDDPSRHSADPDRSGDINARSYRELRSELEGMGYSLERLDGAEQLKLIRDPVVFSKGHTLERLIRKTRRGIIRIHLFFGATAIEEESRMFHLLYRRALEQSSVLLYNGHSGLGGHLDLSSIEEVDGIDIDLPRDRYQIYFFNSCSSYTYYNRSYFSRKRSSQDRAGSRNLDILANGLATYFELENETDLALLRAIDAWANTGTWTSYQTLAGTIDSDNLFGVNGDEDNPTEPAREAALRR
jgi:hypothetical protein